YLKIGTAVAQPRQALQIIHAGQPRVSKPHLPQLVGSIDCRLPRALDIPHLCTIPRTGEVAEP
ncbi:hypothetical protein, partial [Hoyosella altamirensis]|uniref:hypothetical protein n=1 Tax=Hoyosella altamirensis TaxID=616997 RepID=UPI001E38942C